MSCDPGHGRVRAAAESASRAGAGGPWPSGKELGRLQFDPQSHGTLEPVSEPLEGSGSFYLK